MRESIAKPNMKEKLEAYSKGCLAGRRGVPRGANPYLRADGFRAVKLTEEWDMGWNDAFNNEERD